MMPARAGFTMKESGIAWIGCIPQNWNVVKVFQFADQVKDKNTGMKETNLLSLSYGRIIRKDIDTMGGLLPESFEGYNRIRKDDIVLRLTDLQNDHTSLRVGHVPEAGIITSAYVTIRLRNPELSRFVYYALHAFDLCKGLYGMGSGVRQGLNYDDIKILELVLPGDIAVCQQIAAHLDDKCAEIDGMIADAKAAIEDYKLLKQSIITQAVKKGLDPDAELKDSGVEWIGKISKIVEVIRLRFLIKAPLQYGANESGEEFNENLPRYIRITDIAMDGNSLKDEGMLSLSEEASAGYILNDKDMLLARSGASAGKAFLYRRESGRAAFAGYLIRCSLDVGKMLPELFDYYTKSSAYEDWKNQIFIQATIQNIGAEKYKNLFVPVWPLHIQHDIVSYLDSCCSEIDAIIAEQQSLIDDLETAKRSLIYECVTGKRPVPRIGA